MTKQVFMFPGQGAQMKRMGLELFPRFRDRIQAAEGILGYDLHALCAGEWGDLNATEYTQPALFVVNALHYFAALENGAAADLVLGHSLGEYNALLAAGAIDFETGVYLVKHRATAMAMQTQGAMAAVMRLDLGELQARLREHPSGEEVDVANINSRQQIVLAGTKLALDAVTPSLLAAGAIVVPLNVSGAFHSRHMRPAAQMFADVLRDVPLAPQRIPVISNVTGLPHEETTLATRLVEQIHSTVRWLQSVEHLRNNYACEFREIGVGRTLTGLLRHITKDIETVADSSHPGHRLVPKTRGTYTCEIAGL